MVSADAPSRWEDYATVLMPGAEATPDAASAHAEFVPVRTILQAPDSLLFPRGRDRIYAALTAMGLSWQTLAPLTDPRAVPCCASGGTTTPWSSVPCQP